ncbi:MAG: pyridoxal-dependent decarboxylase, exosortase A system-associated [Gammaproteobacteria bacterium]|nr:MAG: pyridoxal-dependent decarboxylase, exosortase A system-associated [Gammaproteobacteria bacterium]
MTYNPLDYFEIRDDCLCIADKTLNDHICSGITLPAYIYSKEIIRKKIQLLRDTLPAAVRVHYSIKANPNLDLISFIKDYVDGLEVSSLAEMKIALSTGIASTNICLTGPGKSYEELEIAVKNNILISAESSLELYRLDEIGMDRMLKPSVLIRVNPTFTQKRAGMKMASGSSQFGIDAENIPDLFKWLNDSCIDLHGFHVYSGSQILDAKAIIYSQNKAIELINEFCTLCKNPIKTINLGGGFGIPYFPYHTPLDLEPIAKNLDNLIPSLKNNNFIKPISPIIELGRFIVGESGIYLCKVVDKKTSRGKTFLITNGGMHHHLAASGNLGQKNRKNFPVCIANKINSPSKETVNIVGKLCTPLDILADEVHISMCEVGDLFAIFQSGAYALSASPINFLSHPTPKEYLL